LEEIIGCWNSTIFASTECWGRKPLLLRQSFNTTLLPSWGDITGLACDEEEEEAITSRLISHQPGTLDTFKLDFGPFEDDFLKESMLNDEKQATTLVVNDVDRLIPSLSDWMDQNFDFLPRWRRDDAQVSLAKVGGGIGPHVDNYDVFLIQATGSREWQVGLEAISVEEEFSNLVEASEVRILNTSVPSIKVELRAGDCLYLPPRIIHWGTSTADDCMTLSVGCRTPSAADLLSKVSDMVVSSSAPSAVERYTDFDLLQTKDKSISIDIKEKMKRLLINALESVLDDDANWDEILGRLVTESNRPVIEYPTPMYAMHKEWKNDLGIWAEAETTLESILGGTGMLRRAEGIAFAWSHLSGAYRLYAQGRIFLLEDQSPSNAALLESLANGPPLTGNCLADLGVEVTPNVKKFLSELLEEGFLYGDDD
jgi:50S ribosomal protein L16 3-hydroxylase